MNEVYIIICFFSVSLPLHFTQVQPTHSNHAITYHHTPYQDHTKIILWGAIKLRASWQLALYSECTHIFFTYHQQWRKITLYGAFLTSNPIPIKWDDDEDDDGHKKSHSQTLKVFFLLVIPNAREHRPHVKKKKKNHKGAHVTSENYMEEGKKKNLLLFLQEILKSFQLPSLQYSHVSIYCQPYFPFTLGFSLCPPFYFCRFHCII